MLVYVFNEKDEERYRHIATVINAVKAGVMGYLWMDGVPLDAMDSPVVYTENEIIYGEAARSFLEGIINGSKNND